MDRTARQYTDLTVIKGISEARQGRLRETSGICTLQDLATISDEEARSVAKRLSGVSADMIKRWRAEAREKLAALPPSEQPSENSAGKGRSNTSSGEWKSFATFVVVVQARQAQDGEWEQRIKIHHKDADDHGLWPEPGMDWPGMSSTEPWEWIAARVGELEDTQSDYEEEATVATASVEPPPSQVAQTKVSVTHVRAYQPADANAHPGVGTEGALFRGMVRGNEPFALEACFELATTNGAKAAQEGGTYHAEFYASNRSTGERIHLNNTEPEPLIENQSSYSAKLPGVTLPPGNYKLQVLITLGDRVRGLGFLEVPMLQVV